MNTLNEQVQEAQAEYDILQQGYQRSAVTHADLMFSSSTLERLLDKLAEQTEKDEEALKQFRIKKVSVCCQTTDVYHRENAHLFPDELNAICRECGEDCELENE